MKGEVLKRVAINLLGKNKSEAIKIIQEDYIRLDIHDFILKCVEGHCNILVSGETGSGKTEFVKYMAAHTKYDEKLITIEDTLELHLDRIFPERDIVAMKTNNIASYADVLVTCMRQNPRWILLSEVRSAEARTPAYMLFALPEDMHLLFRKAVYLEGQYDVELILVPNTQELKEDDTEFVSSQDIQNFINEKTKMVSVDEILSSTANQVGNETNSNQ